MLDADKGPHTTELRRDLTCDSPGNRLLNLAGGGVLLLIHDSSLVP